VTWRVGLLAEFLDWAAREQQSMVDARFRVSLILNPPTNNRCAMLQIEEFEIEPSGWVTQNLNSVGTVTIWENGCIDAEVQTEQTLRDRSDPKYFKHWDDAPPSNFGEMLQPFLDHFSGDEERLR
jgi:hypothetical protein